jgi:ProP effector
MVAARDDPGHGASGPMSKGWDRRNSLACLLQLVRQFPAAFRIDGPRKPLKIGIEDDLALRGISRDVIQRGLDRYCSNSRYRVALQEGAARVGLAGQPAGVVTADEAADARQQLAEEKQSVAAKRLRQQQLAEKDLATVVDVSVGATVMLLFAWAYYTDVVSPRG